MLVYWRLLALKDVRVGRATRHAVRRIAPPTASAMDFAPNRMKITPTNRVTTTPWVRKNRRTAGRPAAKIKVTSASRNA